MPDLELNYTKAEIERIVLEHARRNKVRGYQMEEGQGSIYTQIIAGYQDGIYSSPSSVSMRVSFKQEES